MGVGIICMEGKWEKLKEYIRDKLRDIELSLRGGVVVVGHTAEILRIKRMVYEEILRKMIELEREESKR